MSKRRRRVGQLELVPRSKRATIEVEPTHRLVELTDRLDWDDLEARAELIRANKLKSAAGRPPHLRALLGAMLLMATKRMSYRDARSEEHTSELQSLRHLVCRLLLEKKN